MTKLLISTILGLLAMTLLAPALAATAETLHFSSSGRFAEASFHSTDASGCIETIVSITAVDRRVKDDGAPSQLESGAIATVIQRDVCSGTQLTFAVGTAELAAEAFQIDQLDSATLNTSITVQDFVSGSSFAVGVSLSWQATADPARVRDHFLIQEPGLTVNSRTDGTGRAGTVAGTVTDGTTNFTPEPGVGLLGVAKAGEVVVVRG